MAGLSTEEQAAIRDAISKASNMDEVERLHKMLKAGNIPGQEGNGVSRKCWAQRYNHLSTATLLLSLVSLLPYQW